ncbi:hypothetical protein SARC_11867 [Sphaeroforma arctica JP610]|uniref:Uncharacterized protein n=1 Tax=Sphaeroforma arctica JP610 TaxID=667725 RepID=A0A0L0FGP0_9EUKA|nr:hypothetical protein SARC_11867 [Sphaeroforma arctica JP610]KNC75611.1 hypothetical protein SARC_11867 [Sphaeroforma arctica JP610]|eukprot:XP_014149513.1 hypothetical protein SARC_11867 [Sphaeroforma arctica JP610]
MLMAANPYSSENFSPAALQKVIQEAQGNTISGDIVSNNLPNDGKSTLQVPNNHTQHQRQHQHQQQYAVDHIDNRAHTSGALNYTHPHTQSLQTHFEYPNKTSRVDQSGSASAAHFPGAMPVRENNDMQNRLHPDNGRSNINPDLNVTNDFDVYNNYNNRYSQHMLPPPNIPPPSSHMNKLNVSRSMDNLPAYPETFAAPRGLGLRQYCCVYPSCFSDRVNKRNNIERHVWTQHVRHQLDLSEARYFARSYKKYVDLYVHEVPTRAQPQITPAQSQAANINLDAQTRQVHRFKSEAQQSLQERKQGLGQPYRRVQSNTHQSSLSYPNSRGASPQSSISYTPEDANSPQFSAQQMDLHRRQMMSMHGQPLHVNDTRARSKSVMQGNKYGTVVDQSGMAPGAGMNNQLNVSYGDGAKGLLDVSRGQPVRRFTGANMMDPSQQNGAGAKQTLYAVSAPQSPKRRWDASDSMAQTRPQSVTSSYHNNANALRAGAENQSQNQPSDMLSMHLDRQLRLVQEVRGNNNDLQSQPSWNGNANTSANSNANASEPKEAISPVALQVPNLQVSAAVDSNVNSQGNIGGGALQTRGTEQPSQSLQPQKKQLAPLLAALQAMHEMPETSETDGAGNRASGPVFRPW